MVDPDEDAPIVITKSASNIGRRNATLNAEVDSIGGDSITEYGFYWGTTRACSEQIQVGNEPIEAGDKFDYELSGLSSDHKYYFRAYAINQYGESYGEVKSFNTSGGGGTGGRSSTLTGYPIYTTGSALKKYDTVFDIPAGAVSANTRGDIGRLNRNWHDVPDDSVILGYIYEFTKKASGNFLKPVTVTLPFSRDGVDLDKYSLSIYRYDQDIKEWIELDNIEADEGTISGENVSTGRFAVIATEKLVAPPEPPVLPQPVGLTDITGHWAEEAIRSLVDMGAISGYPDHTFKPQQTITRAEFATVLVKAFKLEQPDGSGKVFEDTAGHWAKDYIAAAYAAGIIEGYSQQQFGPDDPITREQMAVMIARASKLQAENGQLNFTDSSKISTWAYGWVVSAVNNQLMNGYQDQTFRPQANATRAEAVTVIYNALQ